MDKLHGENEASSSRATRVFSSCFCTHLNTPQPTEPRKGIVISSYRSEVTRLQRNQRKRRGRLRRFRRGVERKLFQLDFRFGHVHHLPSPSSPVKNAASGLRNDPRCASTSSSDPPFDRHPSKICKSTSKSITQGLHAENKFKSRNRADHSRHTCIIRRHIITMVITNHLRLCNDVSYRKLFDKTVTA